MLTPEGIKKRFELYRKWFSTLLIKEFLNLPLKQQSKFLLIVEKFLSDCRKVYKESVNVIEKIVVIKIKSIDIPDNKTEDYIIIGEVKETKDEVKIKYPATIPLPEIGADVTCTLFSVDKKVWYSSKAELITGR